MQTRLTAALPVVAGALVFVSARSGDPLYLLAAATVGFALLGVCFARPQAAALLLVVGVPWQLAVLAWLHRIGVPPQLVRMTTFWKEAVILGLALAAVARFRSTGSRVDVADGFAAALLAFVLVYFLFPDITSFGSQTSSLSNRLHSFRTAAVYLVLFVSLRRLGFTGQQRHRLEQAVVGSAVVLAVFALVEWRFRGMWEYLTLEVLDIPGYQRSVLGVPTTNRSILRVGGSLPRYGSLLYSWIGFSFFLVIAFLLLTVRAADRLTARRAVAIGIVGSGLVLGGSRGAIVGALIGATLLIPAQLTAASVRRRVALAGLILAVGLPVALTSTTADRFSGAADSSTSEHASRTSEALDFVIEHPAGAGLGATPGRGGRNDVANQPRLGSGTATSENSYLQVGVELGVVPMGLFTCLVLVAMVRLRRSARLDPFVRGWAAAMTVFALIGLILHVFVHLVPSVVLWAGAGVALPIGRRPSADRARKPAPESVSPGADRPAVSG